MHFSRSSLPMAALLISAVYVIYLGVRSQLDLYIHPRYVFFTITMSVIGLAVLLLNAYLSKDSDQHEHKQSKLLYLPMLFLILSAIFLPARTLSSATVSQRAIDGGSIVSTSQSRPLSALFAGSTKSLELDDWSRLLAVNKDPSFYDNKPATVSGFIYDAGLGDDTVWLARFVLTCCAVDAQPVGVPVQIKDWQAEYDQDEWVEAEGRFKPGETALGEQLILIPDVTSKIDEPDEPYVD